MYSARLGHRWISEESRWRQRFASRLNFNRWEYLDTGLLQSQRISWNLVDLRTASNDNLGFSLISQKETLLDGENPLDRLGFDIAPGEYEFDRWSLNLRTANHRPVSAAIRIDRGDYYDGKQYGVSPGIDWQVNDHVAFELELDYTKYKFDGVEATTRQVTLQNVIAFTSSWSLSTLLQYDNLSDEVGLNSRLHYNRAAGQDFWLVLNHNMQELDPDDPEYRDDSLRSVDTLIALKFRYTFRL
jgi:hypothetical protein